jgi:hypothetical protein
MTSGGFRARAALSAAFMALCLAGPAAGETVHAQGDWTVRYGADDADPAAHFCEAFTRTPRGGVHFRLRADAEVVLMTAHSAWSAPDQGVDGAYQLVVDGGGAWRIRAVMSGKVAVTAVAGGAEAAAGLRAALSAGREAALLSEDGRLLDRFSLRGSTAAFVALDRCALELLPQEWGDEVDAAYEPEEPLPTAAVKNRRGGSGVGDAPARFEDHPPRARLAGAPVAPDFRGRDADFRNYRTRLREAVAAGVNFGGHYALEVVGCGASCRFAMLVDLRTGEAGDFPYGGEEYLGMNLLFSPDSRLVRARWLVLPDGETCLERDLVVEGMDWRVLGERRLPGSGLSCDPF